MVGDKSSTELAIVALSNAVDRVVANKAIEDVLAKLSTESSEDFEFEEDDDEDQLPKPSQVYFGKSTMMKGHIKVLKNTKYINNTDIVRLGEDTILLL